MRYMTIDLETSIQNRGENAVGKNKADPAHPDNHIVWYGWTVDGENINWDSSWTSMMDDLKDIDVLIGQNIKFDLLYLFKERPEIRPLLLNGFRMNIWDTQLAEYLLTGQQHKMWSLDELCKKYGHPLKDDRIKTYWDCNVDTEDIPSEEILPYLKNDVQVTHKIALKQMELIREKGMWELAKSQMKALLATTEMTYNGMHFDQSVAVKDGAEVMIQMEEAEKLLKHRMGVQGIIDANPASNQHISLYLFGGTQTYTDVEIMYKPDGTPVKWKSGAKAGRIRTRKVDREKIIPRMIDPRDEWETKNPNVFKVNEDVLKNIRFDYRGMTKVVEFCTHVLAYRGLAKDLKTYYKAYMMLRWEHDSCIHHGINHANTNTGRLSSSSPNLQNVTGKKHE